MDHETFRRELTDATVGELDRWAHRLQFETMQILDLGCFPDRARLELSFLTTREVATVRGNPSNIASWRWYNFGECEHSSWAATTEIAEWMQETVDADETRWTHFFEACADALMSEEVASALEKYDTSAAFQRTVLDLTNRSYNWCTRSELDFTQFVFESE